MAQQKRIILTVTNNLSYDQRMQRICRSLSAAGYSVLLVGRERPFSAPLSAEPYQQKRLNCIFNKGKLFYVEFNLRLFLFLLFTRMDAVCAIDLDTIVPCYYAGKLKRARLIYDAHEYFTEVPEVVRRSRVQKIWQWVEKTFAPKFDLIYTVSPTLAELFSKKLGKEVHTVMNVPLLEEDKEAVIDNDKPQTSNQYILYQGALNEGRGLEHLLRAMQQVNYKLKLAGEGDLSAQLRKLAKELKIEDKVEFLGYVNPAGLNLITAQAAIGINLLENKGLSYYYSLANKFFDYIHAGVPQVCINFPEYSAINNTYNVALMIDSCSPAEIKTAIERLISDQNLYWQLKKNCEVCSRNLNWQNEEKKLLALYDGLLR